MAVQAAGMAARWFPYVVLAVALVATFMATYYVAVAAVAQDRLRFELTVRQAVDDIANRLDTYIALLRAGAGTFAAAERVTRVGFHAFVDRLDLPRRHPGIQGIGFSVRVLPAEQVALARTMQDEGVQGFRIWPEHGRSEYHAIVYLEPLERRNQAAIGYDMYTEPVRREAMDRARDTGRPAASGKVTLVQEIDERKQAGFLIYAPVYRGTAQPVTELGRRAALLGFVYSPFRADDLLHGMFGAERRELVDFELHDGSVAGPDTLLHRSGPMDARQRLRKERTIEVAGRPWTLIFTARPALLHASRTELVPFVLGGGLAASAILFAMTRAQTRAQQALASSEARLRQLVEANIMGVIVFDIRGNVREANDAFLAMVGHTRAELEAGRLNWKALTPPAHHGRDERALAEMQQSGRHQPYEKECLRRDGTRIPVLVTAVYLGGAEALAFGVLIDLTARKRVEEAREQLLVREQALRRDAEAASRLKDEFLATVSHELRTPLTAMLGWARLLRGGTLDRAAAARAVETIERNAAVQAQLVNDLLDVSSIMAGKIRLERSSVDLVAVVESAVEAVRPAAGSKDVELRMELDRRLEPIEGDGGRLQQVFANLLSNAVKFTLPGGHVVVRLSAVGEVARVVVTDTGRGISQEFLPHVFDRFTQFDSSITRQHGGLGLGLALVHHLVELHGGTVHAASDGEGRGATFTVDLPRQGPLPDDVIPSTADRSAGEPAERLDGTRVLVIDDDEDTLFLVTTILESRGATVRGVSSAAAARQTLAEWRPNVIVSDIGMRDEDGYELIRSVRELAPAAGGRTPAVALTAYARALDRSHALAAGFDVHLSKPIDPDALASAIARLTRAVAL